MKRLSGLLTSAAVAGLGFATAAVALALLPEEPQPFAMPDRAPAVEPVIVAARDLPSDWPAAFGTIPEAAPEPTPEPEPEVIVEAPPEENTTYWLTGLVAGLGGSGMAMLAENDRSIVVRVGDTLIGGETVTAIDASGVWIEYEGERQLIPVQKTNFDGLVRVETPQAATAGTGAGAGAIRDVSLVLESADLGYLSDLLADAARMEPAADGVTLVSVRGGQIFDQMGLRGGDRILAVNGTPVSGPDLLVGLQDADIAGGAIELDVLRAGARQTVRILLDQG